MKCSKVSIAALWGAMLLSSCGSKKDSAPQQGAQRSGNVAVSCLVVQTEVLTGEIETGGSLMAYEAVDLKPELQGRVVSLNIREGQRVAKGELLLKLYDAELQAQLQKLKAQKTIAERTEERQKKLLEINGISKQDYDVSLNQLLSLNADIDYTNAMIEKTEIRAPFSGSIGLRNISVGEIVSPQTIVATLQQTDRLKIDFNIPEKYVNEVKKGDKVALSIVGVADQPSAIITAVEPRIEESTRSLRLRAEIINSKNNLFPGAFAKVTIQLSNIANAITVPAQAVIPDARGKKVIVVKNGLAAFTDVKTGVRKEKNIHVEQGLSPGDTVVISGMMYLRPGAEVAIKEITRP
jgi:membrane fusion protein (multidrug efflux system)